MGANNTIMICGGCDKWIISLPESYRGKNAENLLVIRLWLWGALRI